MKKDTKDTRDTENRNPDDRDTGGYVTEDQDNGRDNSDDAYTLLSYGKDDEEEAENFRGSDSSGSGEDDGKMSRGTDTSDSGSGKRGGGFFARRRKEKSSGKGSRQKETDVRIREVTLGADESNKEDGAADIGKNRNTELVIISYIFIALFISLAVYLVWFNIAKRTEINNNVNNTKEDAAAENVIRGSILTENGEQLAYSEVDYTGNETRVYPYGSLFSHVVGYATNGRAGLEATENSTLLKSSSSLMSQLKDTASSEKRQGDSLIVSLNTTLQQAAWSALGSYYGAVVVMEPDSGKILAMVSKPDFDPNQISEIWDSLVGEDSDSSALLNRATQGLYPPGSTFKIITALTYLREHPDDYTDFAYDCTGSVEGDNITIHCYGNEVHGQEDLESAFANSCNTAFASIGTGLDVSNFRDTAEKFLFNHSLPTDELPYAQSQFVLDRNSTNDEIMTTSIGQGDTLVTPLHMALITSTVANGGIMMKPYVVSGVESADGQTVSTTKPEIYAQLMSVDESAVLTEFMTDVVTNGTASGLSGESFSVAGKTGSAEYESGDSAGTHSWFTGFSNVEDPDIVVTVIAEDGGTGSSTAVPIARQIFETYYSSVKGT